MFVKHAVSVKHSKACLYSLSLSLFFFYHLNFLFYNEVKPINNVVIVPGAQQSDSAIHKHIFIPPQTPLPSRLPHNIEQSSLCCTVDAGEGVQRREPSSTVGGNVNWCSHYEEQYGGDFKN